MVTITPVQCCYGYLPRSSSTPGCHVDRDTYPVESDHVTQHPGNSEHSVLVLSQTFSYRTASTGGRDKCHMITKTHVTC